MSRSSLDRAGRIVAVALAEGRHPGRVSLAVAVLDAGGHPVASERGDGAI